MPEEQKKDELYVPYAAYEKTVAAQERHVGRLIYVMALIVVFFMLAMLAEAGLFIWYLNQYEVVQETVTVDSTDGVANYVGGNGEIHNGQGTGEDRGEGPGDKAETHQEEE